ncbi:DinB family protein [Sphingobacterium paludis]|uniref:DinB family protein n=1 Tax=Sphingobacterium paludis TaxID=1476465 RepID=A0A4R7CXI0_9SPHI|nr:DinB family protein [Sphingobacterium paludis]TDS13243.1 DinB family protein [Sphingobacterium paludis]
MENEREKREVWMRGPVAHVPALLQPVAHTLLQVQEDTEKYMHGFSEQKLWIQPGGAASVAFHLQHIAGVIDRMFSYAHNKPLTALQLAYLSTEGEKQQGITKESLLQNCEKVINHAITQLQDIAIEELHTARYLGRKRIPTTLIGLIFHAAEHSQRHLGQMLVTIKWLSSDDVKTC